jgi:three-Cys-motif partner protein
MKGFKLDEIGPWSEIKLEIIKKYSKAFSLILSRQPSLQHAYIDAFSGAGIHTRKIDQDLVQGSPLNALKIAPPFNHYYFIDLDGSKVNYLKKQIGERTDVTIYKGDCNNILISNIFPNFHFHDRRRALCLLDPYGLHLNWDVIKAAGMPRTIEIFLNFPVLDMNRNVLWKKPHLVDKTQLNRMNAFWGDDSWRESAYDTSQGELFGGITPLKRKIESIVESFKDRLKNVAGFNYVVDPLAMRGKSGATYYYIFFASPNRTGAKIARDIFKKYRK